MKSLKRPTAIAITRAAGIFPGASNLAQYWDNILAARVSQKISMEKAWGISKERYSDKLYQDQAFCLPELDLAKRQVAFGQRTLSQLLSGVQLDPKSTALVAATSWTDPSFFEQDIQAFREKGLSANRVEACSPDRQLKELAQSVKIEGTLLAVDTACASSLYAIDTALSLILSGRAQTVALLGLNAFLPPFLYLGFSKLMALSKTGEILPFSSAANGIVPGEASVAILLETVESAQAAGRESLGVIRSLGLSADGNEGSIFSPGLEGQKLAYQRAYQQVDPATIQYLEAHGTATELGDQTEIEVLNGFFNEHSKQWKNQRRLPLGSVKGNIGHTLAAAGLAALVKGLLILKNKTLPPHIAVDPHPRLRESCMELLKGAQPLPAPEGDEGFHRVAISSLGFGGANGHLVLESADRNPTRHQTYIARPAQAEAIAIVDAQARIGKHEGREALAELLTSESAPSKERFSAQSRFGFDLDSKIEGHFLPSKLVIDADGFRSGPNLLKRIDPLQLLVAAQANQILHRHPSLRNSSDTGVVTLSNLGGEMGLRLCRKYSEQFQTPEAAPELTVDAIGSGLPALTSGYPAFHFNLKAFHETWSGPAGVFWDAIAAAPYFFGNRCRQLLVSASHQLISPLSSGSAEGAACFLLKSGDQAKKDGDKVLGWIERIVMAEEASDLETACRVSGLSLDQIHHEVSQLDQDSQAKGAQARVGFLAEATGMETLLAVLSTAHPQSVIELRSGSRYLGAVFVKKGSQEMHSSESATSRPLELIFDRYENQAVVRKPVQGTSAYHVICEWNKATTSAVTSYFQAQAAALTAIAKRPSNQTFVSAPVLPFESLRRDSKNWVIDQIQSRGKVWTSLLRIDEGHPYFFDHPLDHVPGILILEGVIQLIEAKAMALGHSGVLIRKMDISFKKFCEKNTPIQIELHDEQARITQSGALVCVCDLETMPLQEKSERVLKQANLRDLEHPNNLPDRKLLHKHRDENILVHSFLDERAQSGPIHCSLIHPRSGHLFADGHARAHSMLYFLETSRQFVMLIAHQIQKIPLGVPMNLISVQMRLDVPIPRTEPLSIVCEDHRLIDFGGSLIATVKGVLKSGDQVIGQCMIKAQVVSKEKYEAQRKKEDRHVG